MNISWRSLFENRNSEMTALRPVRAHFENVCLISLVRKQPHINKKVDNYVSKHHQTTKMKIKNIFLGKKGYIF